MKNGPYNLVIAPENYPGKKYRGRYAYEHHVVWWKNKKEIYDLSDIVIHHINHNKRDNRIENLEVLSRANHKKHHARPKTIITKPCGYCGINVNKEKRLAWGRKEFYCSRKHQHLSMTKAFRGSSVAE